MLKVFRFFDRIIISLGLLVLLSLVVVLGFDLSESVRTFVYYFIMLTSCFYFAREVHRFISIKNTLKFFAVDWFDNLIVFLMFLGGVWGYFGYDGRESKDFLILFWGCCLSLGLFSTFVDRLETRVGSSRLKLLPSQLFIGSFVFPILVGTLMLMMPKASHVEMSLVDALFMSTSAVSVTGLGVFDLNQLTFLGQCILLVLIQLGGIGMMTLALTFTGILAGGLGLKDRLFLCEIFSEKHLSAAKSLLVKVCLFTFVIEGVGVLSLYGARRSFFEKIDSVLLWDSIFHSISAFCNAGFSLSPKNIMDPGYAENTVFLCALMILIVLGGLGFPTLANIQKISTNFFKKKRDYRIVTTSTRIVLSTTLFLLVLGWGGVFLIESAQSFVGMSFSDMSLNSLFLSITSRTAGFNLFPTENLSVITLFFLIFLMWIGGAPMSTAGGIKVTTFFLSILNVWSYVRGTKKIEVFGRLIRPDSVHRAYAVVITSLAAIFIGTIVLVFLEPAQSSIDLLFEVVSAMSTVGLSRGVTYSLNDYSKIVISILMFIGRVGVLTFLMALIKQERPKNYKLLEDDVIIH